ncbi:amino acid adenylation domain-containing protein [Duganella sp.]|uniref:amino acid adenylation domain-containing protein n=1 Tax=Duganella sp. TaxID=1904440 RepID=UPI0031D3C83A
MTDKNRAVPLSLAQQQLWFLQKLNPALTAYNLPRVLRFSGALDADALERAFRAVIVRHAVLRHRFFEYDGVPMQQAQDTSDFVLERLDFSSLSEEEYQHQLNQQIARIAGHVFDLENGATLVACLMRRSGQEHVLALCLHHIVSDAWSNRILARDLSAAYRTGSLPALALQYADYALSQSQLEGSEAQLADIAYWNNYLGQDVPSLDLPTDRVRPARQSYQGGAVYFDLAADVSSALLRFCREEKSSPFMVLMAAWQVLLARYSGQYDFAVGVPNAGRQREEVQEMIGYFITTQVFRARLSPHMSLRDTLRQVRADALAALEHAELPFETLLESRAERRDPARSPLFQVMLGVQMDDALAELDFGAVRCAAMAFAEYGAKFDLSLDVSLSAQRVRGRLEYNSRLFDVATAERLAGCFQHVLAQLATNPAQHIADLALLDDDDRAQLARWGVNARRYPDQETVLQLFEREAATHPDAPALLHGDETLSYAELNRRANRLAQHLIAQGVRPETPVGVALERSTGMIVGLLAILKAGGAYVPLDPDYPQERLAAMIADSGMPLLLTQSSAAARIPTPAGLRVLNTDTIDLSSYGDHNPSVVLHGAALAYIIYTSGSTGKPKGIGITHATLAEHSQVAQGYFGLTRKDRMLQFSTINFDGFVEQLFPALTCGAAVVLRGPALWDSATFRHELLARGITIADLPTAYWHMLAQDFARLPASQRQYGALRQVQATGEAMPPDGVQAWRDAGLAHVKLLNSYGPTEAVVTAVTQDCHGYLHGDAPLPAQMPIGQPLAGRHCYVLDANLALSPPGAPGELYIGGALLARGYLGRAGLSAERFVADPFDHAGGRLYRTGDLARWNNAGQLEYLGRTDHQVKIRGFRIELGEIEARLLALPQVSAAVVVALAAPGGSQQLAAYVAAAELDAQAVRSSLSAHLPDYMVPASVTVLDVLPLNANGKIDRKALPPPDWNAGAQYEVPQGAAEQALADIWADVLGHQRVGRHDNFFELGGHSLLAIRLLEHMRRAGWHADVRLLFQHPELAAFARAVEAQSTATGEKEARLTAPANGIPDHCTAITPSMLTMVSLTPAQISVLEQAVPGGAANIQDVYPLVPLQEGILFHHLLQSAGDAYVTRCLLSFDSETVLQRFIADLNQVIARHDILRTAILWEGLPAPVQLVYRQAPLTLEWLQPGSDAHARLQAYVDPAHYRIDVRQAPLLRAIAVHDVSEQRWLLQLPSHNLVLDHTTQELLIEEIALIQQGRAAELPVPVPFRDFVARARQGVSEAEHERFMQSLLGDVEEPTAPFGILDVQGDGIGVEELRLPLDARLAADVRRLAQQLGVSPAAIFHLAWAAVLARTSGKDDVVFGTVMFGRMQGGAGIERALGMFINTLPVRARLRGVSVGRALRDMHALLTDLLRHEHASLTLAQRCSGLAAGTPLFSALFNYRYSPRAEEGAQPVLQGMQVLGGGERTSYPYTLSVDDLGRGYGLVLQVTERVGAQRMADYMVAALAALSEALEHAPTLPIEALPLAPLTEAAALLRLGVNGRRYPDQETVLQLFEREAATHPDAPALLHGDETLTYAELNRRANRLAQHLIAQGVRPETPVGVALERSTGMIVGLLAILKAGGAYVPLDPDYPQERLAAMIADSGMPLLLTQSSAAARIPTPAGLRVLNTDTIDLSSYGDHNPSVVLHGAALAYIIYTSGSTGKPKGIGITHATLAEHSQVAQGYFGLTRKDRMLQFSTINFDGFVEQLFPALTCGAAVVLRGPALWDSATFRHELLARGITIADLPTAYWHMLAQDFARLPASQRQYGALRQVQATGEAMPPDGVQAWRDAGLAHVKLLNSYGPTEAVVTAVTQDCHGYLHGDAPLPAQMPIGQPLAGRHCYVLDANLALSPPGAPGELYIGGALLARGYLGRAGLSAERFVADPFDHAGGRLYRTGDLARWNNAGQLEYLGRTDHQVKIRGFRIELGEIEARLLALPQVSAAVVVALAAPGGSQQLAAYVAAAELDAQAVRSSLSAHLPDYMVPASVTVLDVLPLNANGKIDRKALPPPDWNAGAQYEVPQNVAEQALADIWADVLGQQRVGRHDNFFELGGHSLTVMTLAAQLRQRHGISIPLRAVFEMPTIAALAAIPALQGLNGGVNEDLAAIDALLAELES